MYFWCSSRLYLVLNFSYYALVTFLMMFSVKLLFMLMMSLFTKVWSGIRLMAIELAFESKYDLRDTVNWGRKWLVDFNAGKTQLILVDMCYWCENGWVYHPLRYQGCLFLLNWVEALTLSLLVNLPPRKKEHWFALWNTFLLRLHFNAINLQCGIPCFCHVWPSAPSRNLDILDKLQIRVCGTVCW